MKLLAMVISATFIFTGCKKESVETDVAQVGPENSADPRVASLGIVRVSSTYTLASGNFRSTCSGILLHGGDQSLRECVVLSAAHCFKNYPRGTEHNVEFIDSKGIVQKVFPVRSVQIHPAFKATDAKLSMQHAAVDAAVLKFMCSLPVSIKSARVVDFSQVPIGSRLLTTKFIAVSEAEKPKDEKNKLPDALIAALPVTSARLVQVPLQLRSIDFPLSDETQPEIDQTFVGPVMPSSTGSNKPQPGLLSLEGREGEGSCEIDAGSPVIFDDGRELLIVGHTSAGLANCASSPARATLISPLMTWMEEVVGEGVISFADRSAKQNSSQVSAVRSSALDYELKPLPLGTTIQTAKVSPTPTATQTTKPAITPAATAIPTQATKPAATPAVTAIPTQSSKPAAAPAAPSPATAIAKQIEKPRLPLPKPKLALPPFQAEERPLIRATVPPLPEPEETEEAVVRVCTGRRWGVSSKTRVWGTVITLVDKDSSQIADENLKCDIPNDTELCLVSHPVSTGTGRSKAELLEDVDVGGCEKFKAGGSIYMHLPDFMPR